MLADILVVEDEPTVALQINQQLVQLGYQVAIANDGESALEALAQHRSQLVLMDDQLQGTLDSLVTASQIRAEFNIPVLFLTAHSDCATLNSATLNDATLNDATLNDATLNDATLNDATLNSATLNSATLNSANLTKLCDYILKPCEETSLVAAIETSLQRHRTELAIHQILQRETELSNLKSQFISTVSHEFRTPLSIILFSLDLLEQSSQSVTPEKRQQYIHRARSAIALMEHLLDDILVMGELRSNHLKFQPMRLDISQFCQEILVNFQAERQAHHQIIFSEVYTAGAEPSEVCVDQKLLRLTVSHLLSNAMKYSPKGGRVLVQLVCGIDNLTVEIQDEGIGIPNADQPHLFDAFYRGSNISTIQGMGMGLAIAKSCVELQGGTITFDSTAGSGTTFTVKVPLASL